MRYEAELLEWAVLLHLAEAEEQIKFSGFSESVE